ncbi:MAG TPA: hypothetical protein VIF62_19910 [Labilithrix sp.]
MRYFLLFVFPFAIVACGSSSPSSSSSDPSPSSSSSTEPASDSPCVATTKTLCERACACRSDGKCQIAYGGGTVTEIHDSIDDCRNFYQFYVCANADYAKGYDAACGSAIASAACITTAMQGGAVGFPDACHVQK